MAGNKAHTLVQACWSIGNPSAKEREISSLIKGSEEPGCGNLIILTEQEEGEEAISGKKIRVLPLWKSLFQNQTFK